MEFHRIPLNNNKEISSFQVIIIWKTKDFPVCGVGNSFVNNHKIITFVLSQPRLMSGVCKFNYLYLRPYGYRAGTLLCLETGEFKPMTGQTL